MNHFRLLILLITVLAGVIVLQNARFNANNTKKETLGADTIASSSATPDHAVTPTDEPSSTPTLPPPTDTPSFTGDSSFLYPNATVISQAGNTILLQSSDSPDSIFDWYKKIIQDKNLGAKSFIKTNSNGKIDDKLAGASDTEQIRIEITKDKSDTNAKITVSY